MVGGIMLSVLLIQRGMDDLDDPENEDLGKIEVGLGAFLAFVMVMMILALWFIRYVIT